MEGSIDHLRMEQKAMNQTQDKIVTGANMLAHFNIRCPSCDKLFRVDAKEIKSTTPHFDCTACKTRFCFDYPPENVNRIETRVISMKDTFQLDDSVDRSEIPEIRKCPKCESMNPRLSKECIKCGVIFERVESLKPEDAMLGAIPSLVKAWHDLLGDYDNLKKHVAFVDRCEDLQALPFALKKYQHLKEAQPQDGLVDNMIHRVLLRKLKRKTDSISQIQSAKEHWFKAQNLVNANVNWVRLRKLAPLALAMALILVGLSSQSARNMVGVGAAIVFLTLGIRVFLKGRLAGEDFW